MKAQDRLGAAEGEWQVLYDAECARFGRTLPTDALVLDVLLSVRVDPGDVWTWKGMVNNKGLPTFRIERSDENPNGGERSVVRLLAVAFGVIDPDDPVLLYPTTSPRDVNPFHRKLRRGVKPTGNPRRYTTKAA